MGSSGGNRRGALCRKMVGSSRIWRDKPRQKAGTVRGIKKSVEVVRGFSTHVSRTKEIT
jgi:hypothetical protein